MKKKYSYIIAIIVIITVAIICIVYLSGNKKIAKIKEITDFDITAISYLDLMPGANPNKYAYFDLILNGIDKNDFLNEYEIENIYLNGNVVKDIDSNNKFRFYSKRFKDNNVIYVIIKNKKTNMEYSKKIEVLTKKVY